MRVIGGKYKGKSIKYDDKASVRPTKDKVREALFSSIQTMIEDSKFLDLFAGSGSIGIEALSRGASYVELVENDRKSIATIKQNLNNLSDPANIKVNHENTSAYLKKLKGSSMKFDIIFLDPPYLQGLDKKAAEEIINSDLLSDEGILIIERDKHTDMINIDGLGNIKTKRFGNTCLDYFVKE